MHLLFPSSYVDRWCAWRQAGLVLEPGQELGAFAAAEVEVTVAAAAEAEAGPEPAPEPALEPAPEAEPEAA